MQDQFSEGEWSTSTAVSTQGVQAGDRFFILHRIRPLDHPISNSKLGMIYTQVGQLKVLCAQEHTAIAEITYACDPMAIGDVLKPFSAGPGTPGDQPRSHRPLRRPQRQADSDT